MRALVQICSRSHAFIDAAQLRALSERLASFEATLPVGVSSLADLLQSKAASDHQERVYSSNAACPSGHWESMGHHASTSNESGYERGSRPSSRVPSESFKRSPDAHLSSGIDARFRHGWRPFDRGQSSKANATEKSNFGERYQHTRARNEEQGDDQLSPSQSDQPSVQPSPASQLQVEDVVRHPALIVTRNVEWGTVILGFEQANKYTVLDQDGNTVALLAEDTGGLGKEVGRQFLRTRRSFTATILRPEGQVVLRLRRPMYFVNSTIYVENAEGEVIGEVRQRFHLWQRNYDIYLDRRQIAVINSPLLAWEFAIKDAQGGVLALIDRNFQGFGKELFTDAGKYIIHFGDKPAAAAEQAANTVQAAHPDKPRPDVTALAKIRTDVSVIPTATGNQLEVVRPLSVDERTLILATAVSIDFDYFSQHSHGSGLLPFGFMPFPGAPVPYPSDGGEETGSPEAGQEGEGPTESNGEGNLDNSEGDFGSGGVGGSGGGQGSGFDEQPDLQGGDGEDFGEVDDSAGWSSELGGGDEEGSTFGSLFDLGRDLFGSDD